MQSGIRGSKAALREWFFVFPSKKGLKHFGVASSL